MMKKSPTITIGYAEYVDLPDWGIVRLKAKADTGARTSALHVDSIERLPRGRVRFEVVLSRRFERRRVPVEAPIVRVSRVRSSNGEPDERIIVRTAIQLGGVTKEIEVSLASRRDMTYRMLLGRLALQGHFVVDPSHRYLITGKAGKRRRARGRAKGAE